MVRQRGKLWVLRIAVAALIFALPAAMLVAADEAAPEHKAPASEKIADKLAAGDLGKQETAIAWIPDNTAFYISLLHCRQQIDAVAHSKAWDRLMKLPVVAEKLKQYQTQAEDPESPAGKVQSGLANPQVQSALKFLADLLGQEAFVCGDPNYVDFLRLCQRINGANRCQMISSAIQGKTGSEVQEQQGAAMLHVLAQNADLIKVPNTIAGFRITDKQQARQNLDVVAGFLALGSAMVPELNGRFSRKTIGKCEYLVLSLDGKLIPWDKVPLDDLREHEVEKGDVDKVVDKLKGLTLVLAMGLRDEYLIAATVDSTNVLAALGTGKPLGSRPEFKPLAASADKTLTTISYLSKDLASQAQASPQDLDDLVKQLGDYLGKTDLPEEDQARIRSDAASLAADLKPWLPKPGAKMGFSYLTATGCESYFYDWGPNPQADPSRPLGLLAHVGGDPLVACIATRQKTSARLRSAGQGRGSGPLLLQQVRPAEDEIGRAGEVPEVRISRLAALQTLRRRHPQVPAAGAGRRARGCGVRRPLHHQADRRGPARDAAADAAAGAGADRKRQGCQGPGQGRQRVPRGPQRPLGRGCTKATPIRFRSWRFPSRRSKRVPKARSTASRCRRSGAWTSGSR